MKLAEQASSNTNTGSASRQCTCSSTTPSSPKKAASGSKKPATTSKEPPSVSKKPTPGSMPHYGMAVTDKRKKPCAEPYPKKKPDQAQAKSKVKDLEEEAPAVHTIDVGLLVYKDNALVQTPTIFNINQTVDLSDPDLFKKLPTALWKTFSKDIPNNTSIRHLDLPKDPKPFLTLLHSKSPLTNLEALLFIIQKIIQRKDACSEISEVPRKKAPTSKSKPSHASSSSKSTDCSVVLQKKRAPSKSKHERAPSPCESTESTYPKEIYQDKHQAASDRASAWALGGVACTVPARGKASLNTQLGFLARAVPSSSLLLINDHGWLNGYQLEYNTCGKAATNTNAAPQYPWLQAECQPITFKIY
ncbi:hypothetical protein KEM48_013691 [Puccinia striiformis f. sp. tritici PST-130]|nr:hypothetical protein KEM48_013691 [Puccinia striiformis f. sp. tritici PST-130]